MKVNSCIGLASHFKRGRCPEHGFCLLFALLSSRLFNSLSRVVDLRENREYFLRICLNFFFLSCNFSESVMITSTWKPHSLGHFGDFCKFLYTCNVLNKLTRKYLNPFFFPCFRGKLLVLHVYSCLNALWLI